MTSLLSPPEISAPIRLGYSLVSEHNCSLRPSLNRIILSVLFPPFSILWSSESVYFSSPSPSFLWGNLTLLHEIKLLREPMTMSSWYLLSPPCNWLSASQKYLVRCFPLLISFSYVYIYCLQLHNTSLKCNWLRALFLWYLPLLFKCLVWEVLS